jgi:hypothetical protein
MMKQLAWVKTPKTDVAGFGRAKCDARGPEQRRRGCWFGAEGSVRELDQGSGINKWLRFRQ